MPTASQINQLVAAGRLAEARRQLDKAGPEVASDPVTRRAAARLALGEGRGDDAVGIMRELLERESDPRDAELLAVMLRHLQRHEEGIRYCREWLERWPDRPELLCQASDHLEAVGRSGEALEHLRRAVEVDADRGSAWYRLTMLGDYDWMHGHRERLLAPAGPERGLKDRYSKEFAAGRYLEKQGRWDEAFERLSRGNELRRSLQPYDFKRKVDAARTVMDDWASQDWTRAAPGHESRAPIFVVGMPRSGTSMVEQIVDSHPDVRGIGESLMLRQEIAGTLRASREPVSRIDWRAPAQRYLDRVRALTGDTPRFIDKMMFNFNTLGFIRRMFPNAHIIHCRRDTIDICISCFRTCFESPELSYNLRELGWFYGCYEGMMAFWQEQFPEAITEVRYETLVASPREQIARLLEALDLEWNEACVAFHENPRNVKTASMYQVRQPAHTASVGRAEPYRRYLAPLEEGIEEARSWMRRDAAA